MLRSNGSGAWEICFKQPTPDSCFFYCLTTCSKIPWQYRDTTDLHSIMSDSYQTMFHRYSQLEISRALSRKYDYAEACTELALILREVYSKSPKNLQTVLFQDTITAFQILPEVGTKKVLSAANSLLQAAEASLPKQKRGLAVAEYKRSVVTVRRKSKHREREQEISQLPDDVLTHVFSFLDVRSLVSAASVCRSWNVAAREASLWKRHYVFHFGNNLPEPIIEEHEIDKTEKISRTTIDEHTDWHQTFMKRIKENPSQVLILSRAFCKICKSPIWLKNSDINPDLSAIEDDHHHIPGPVRPVKVLHFLLGDSEDTCSSSSDSDSEGMFPIICSRLWVYPWRIDELYP